MTLYCLFPLLVECMHILTLNISRANPALTLCPSKHILMYNPQFLLPSELDVIGTCWRMRTIRSSQPRLLQQIQSMAMLEWPLLQAGYYCSIKSSKCRLPKLLIAFSIRMLLLLRLSLLVCSFKPVLSTPLLFHL
jgi:hypothetical protein